MNAIVSHIAFYKQEIYVRDCVVIKADTEKQDNPYVAKIGSIWQESGILIILLQ